jgi:membrane-associated phospholipid phosphatase
MNKMLLLLIFINLLNAKSNIEKAGDIVQIMIPSGAYISTIYLNDDEGRNEFYKSFVGTFLTTHLLKRTVLEKRPNGTNRHSFPSGHTSASFQGATFIHKKYGLKAAIIPYLGASFVAYSRVYAKQHYTHDVVAGALIGSSFSWYFTTSYSFKDKKIQAITYKSLQNDVNLYGVNIKW